MVIYLRKNRSLLFVSSGILPSNLCLLDVSLSAGTVATYVWTVNGKFEMEGFCARDVVWIVNVQYPIRDLTFELLVMTWFSLSVVFRTESRACSFGVAVDGTSLLRW